MAGGRSGMRRAMSVNALSSLHVPQEIHTITEGEVDSSENRRRQRRVRTKAKSLQVPEMSKSEACIQTGEAASSEMTTYAVPEHGLATSEDCRRPGRYQHPTGMPLRSSLKSTTSLRSSLKSTTTAASMGDESHHSAASCSSLKSSKSCVSFSSLEIRSYNVTLGDAPTAHGPPVALGWDYDASATEEYDVDQYEHRRATEAPRRSLEQLALSPRDRQWRLIEEAGFRRGELQSAADEAQRVRRQRETTRRGVKLGFVPPLEEALEKAQRARRRFSLGKKTQSSRW